jgi:hypothetical protein
MSVDTSRLTIVPPLTIPPIVPEEDPFAAPVPAPEPVKKKKTGLILGLIAGLLVLLAALGFLYWHFVLSKDQEPQLAQSEPVEEPQEPQPEESEPGEPLEEPAPVEEAPQEPPEEAPVADLPSEPPAPVEDAPAGPSAPTAVDRAERLINSGGSQAQMEQAYDEFKAKSDEDSLDAGYRLVQTLSKYNPKYRSLLGEYFDPLSKSAVPGYITKNAMTAYLHYTDAEKQGFQEAKAKRDSLISWSKSPEAQGVPGASEVAAMEN